MPEYERTKESRQQTIDDVLQVSIPLHNLGELSRAGIYIPILAFRDRSGKSKQRLWNRVSLEEIW